MLKRETETGTETFLTKKEALANVRSIRQRLEQEYAKPFEVKEVNDGIKNVNDLFDFYKLCGSYGFKMEWRGFKKMWQGLDSYAKNEFYNYINVLREKEHRDIEISRAKLAEALTESIDDGEMLVEKVIHFRNNDVPKFLRRLSRAERYSLEHPSELKFMTGVA
jgi:hypothetical protein